MILKRSKSLAIYLHFVVSYNMCSLCNTEKLNFCTFKCCAVLSNVSMGNNDFLLAGFAVPQLQFASREVVQWNLIIMRSLGP